MKLLMMIVIGLAVGGGIYYYVSTQQIDQGSEVNQAQNEAQQAADAYKQQQADMMKALEQ